MPTNDEGTVSAHRSAPPATDPVDAVVAVLLREQGSLSTTELAARLGISRQAAHRHVRRRVESGRLIARGNTRSRRYVSGAIDADPGTATDGARPGAVVPVTASESASQRIEPRDWHEGVRLGPMLLAERAHPYDVGSDDAGSNDAAESATAPTLRRSLEGLREDHVWVDLVTATPALEHASAAEAEPILAYVFTELINNAIDHSSGRVIEVGLAVRDREGAMLHGMVRDDGLGAFEVARRAHELADHVQALQELSKGKLTSMPDRHSGEGLFFSSKSVDHFELEANGLVWVVDNQRGDQAIAEIEPATGTVLRFDIALPPRRTLAELFGAYTTDFAFDRTRCMVRLFEYGTRFVSRSEAKRLAQRLEAFRRVIVDFHGVQMVGQGFTDELFRVWASEHPTVELLPVNMVPPVAFMVRRGLGAR